MGPVQSALSRWTVTRAAAFNRDSVPRVFSYGQTFHSSFHFHDGSLNTFVLKLTAITCRDGHEEACSFTTIHHDRATQSALGGEKMGVDQIQSMLPHLQLRPRRGREPEGQGCAP